MLFLNGRNMFINDTVNDKVEVDACNTGAGMTFRSDWAYINWELDWEGTKDLHINFKETLAIIGAAKRWGPLWRNKTVFIYTDNQCAKQIINKGTTRNSFIMSHIRELFWLSILYNFEIRCVYIPGVDNKVADAISRLHEKGQFYNLELLLAPRLHSLLPTGLRFHMSKSAIHFLILQILLWLESRQSWMPK